VLATPLLSGTSPYLLPPLWTTVSPWSPTGAMRIEKRPLRGSQPTLSRSSVEEFATWGF
jgi:hypothetical protein